MNNSQRKSSPEQHNRDLNLVVGRLQNTLYFGITTLNQAVQHFAPEVFYKSEPLAEMSSSVSANPSDTSIEAINTPSAAKVIGLAEKQVARDEKEKELTSLRQRVDESREPASIASAATPSPTASVAAAAANPINPAEQWSAQDEAQLVQYTQAVEAARRAVSSAQEPTP